MPLIRASKKKSPRRGCGLPLDTALHLRSTGVAHTVVGAHLDLAIAHAARFDLGAVLTGATVFVAAVIIIIIVITRHNEVLTSEVVRLTHRYYKYNTEPYPCQGETYSHEAKRKSLTVAGPTQLRLSLNRAGRAVKHKILYLLQYLFEPTF